MKSLTLKQTANLNKLINTNNDYITTSVCGLTKSSNKLVVEILAHTKESTKSLFVTLNNRLEFISINGNHSLPNYLTGKVNIN